MSIFTDYWRLWVAGFSRCAFYFTFGAYVFGDFPWWLFAVITIVFMLSLILNWDSRAKKWLFNNRHSLEPTKWWKATDKNGRLLAETSTPSDFTVLGLYDNKEVKFWRLWRHTESEMEWRRADPRPVWERKK